MRKTITLFLLAQLFFITLNLESKACSSYFTYNRACAGDTVWFHPLDPSAVYCWTFGDLDTTANVSFDQEPYHIFSSPGTYYVTLFTNIGAEWDYYTTVVEIGTECFEADFHWDCSDSLQIAFSDYSVGNSLSRTWYFGDPASGTNDTSMLVSPAHNYSGPGTYSVQLIVSDGVQSDTISKYVTVYGTCLGAVFVQTLILPCWGDTFAPYVIYSGNILGYAWDFGNPASGVNNISNLPDPVHVYWAPGVYTVRLIVTDSVVYDTNYLYVEVVDCRVWPGDVNRDGEVNGDDLFGIGIYFGNTGVARPGATSTFTPQNCPDWPGFSNLMYLQDILNAKYADCDGNGIINAADINVILNNFGAVSLVANNHSEMQNVPITAPELGFETESVDAWSGATTEMPVSLGINDSARAVYGVSLTIRYDPYLVSYITADFYNSWLGINNYDMLVITYDDWFNGEFHVSAIRDTKTTRSGKGEILRLYVYSFGSGGTTPLVIEPSAKVISNGQFSWQNNQMVVIPVEILNSEIEYHVGVEEFSSQQARIYPNPARDEIFIESPGNNIIKVEVVDIMGAVVLTSECFQQDSPGLNIEKLATGLYQLRLFTDGGDYFGRFMKY